MIEFLGHSVFVEHYSLLSASLGSMTSVAAGSCQHPQLFLDVKCLVCPCFESCLTLPNMGMLKPHEQYEKAKRHRKMSPPGWKVSSMVLGKSGGQLLTAPERMKSLGQSGNCACVWWRKSDAVKTNIA